MRDRTIRILSFLSAAIMLLRAANTGAAADLFAFSTDTERVFGSFASEYGWESEKTGSDQWTGKDGITRYQRASGHQKEYFEDLWKWNLAFCEENGLVPESLKGTGTGGYNIAAVARAEADAADSGESPPGSNHVKYNTWFYGREVYGDSFPWCAVFVSWCADRCGLINSGLYSRSAGVRIIYDYQTETNGFESYSWREIRQLGGGEYSPVPGDLFFFEGYGHMGIITEVTDTGIEVTHGNSADNRVTATVMRRGGTVSRGSVVHVEYPNDAGAIFYYLTDRLNLPASSAAGILANMEHESNFNPAALGDGGTSYGLCQWHNPDRWDRMKAFCDGNGYDWQTVEGQLFYLEYELKTAYSGLYSELLGMDDSGSGAYRAAYRWCVLFEVPEAKEVKGAARGELARTVYYPRYRTV